MLTPEETLRIAKKLEAQGIDAAEQGRQRQLLGQKLWEFMVREFLLQDEPADAGVMTRRDTFAASAMPVALSIIIKADSTHGMSVIDLIPAMAYKLADAMLKAGAK